MFLYNDNSDFWDFRCINKMNKRIRTYPISIRSYYSSIVRQHSLIIASSFPFIWTPFTLECKFTLECTQR